MTKMTNALALAFVLDNYDLPSEVREKIEKIREQTIAHNSRKSDKPTAKQKANDDFKTTLLAQLEVGRKYTIGEMLKVVPCCDGLSSQKVSAMANQLADVNLLNKSVEKRTSYFERIA